MLPLYLPSIFVPIIGLFLPFLAMGFFFVLVEKDADL